jgi:hypothetical protein
MTRSKTARMLLVFLFVALMATPLVIRRLSERRGAPSTKLDTAAALARYGFYLEDIARTSGVNFNHHSPTLDHQLDHIMPQVASMGAAVSIVDFDRDGWADIYVTNSGEGSKNSLYRNLKDGSFSDVAGLVGLADLNQVGTGVSMGAVWGDYDNDGYEDLFLYKWGRPELFHNEGGQRFVRASEKAGLPSWVNANTAIWFDYDRDG